MPISNIYLVTFSNTFCLRCMKLALVHDMAECIVGDITPYCGVSKEEKHTKEKVSIDILTVIV